MNTTSGVAFRSAAPDVSYSGGCTVSVICSHCRRGVTSYDEATSDEEDLTSHELLGSV